MDYFHKTHEKQRHRLVQAWVFTARYDAGIVSISQRPAPSLADAIIYADAQSRVQYTNCHPKFDKRLTDKFTIRDVGKHNFVLEIPPPTGEVAKAKSNPSNRVARSTTYTRGKAKLYAEDYPWQMPRQHKMEKTFILKTAHGNSNVANEIGMLKKIRNAGCDHLPELVWEPGGDGEFGILPVCEPITFREEASFWPKIVEGLMKGLKWLHTEGIIHRDIRPSNLVIKGSHTLVIIDYETAVMPVEGQEVEYAGGFICWPKRLITSNRTHYVPEAVDDLLASILAVLHMVYPSQYEGLRVSSIGVHGDGERSPETQHLLDLWDMIEKSRMWGRFVKAAERCDYEMLKEMGDVFCF